MPKNKKRPLPNDFSQQTPAQSQYSSQEGTVDPLISKPVTITSDPEYSWQPVDGLSAEGLSPKLASREVVQTRQHHPKSGVAAFDWLLSPVSTKDFLFRHFEKNPLHIKRDREHTYYSNYFGLEEMKKIMNQDGIKYSVHVGVTQNKRGTFKVLNSNIDGSTHSVEADSVWQRFKQQGCCVRVASVEKRCDALWPLVSKLETFWTSDVTCNAVLTPCNQRGLPARWDEVDSFVMQVEGRQNWKVYAPRSLEEALPREPSGDLDETDLPDPVMEMQLGPGDLLYLPRGYIYQASCGNDPHSLHLMLTTNRKNTWMHLLEAVVPAALIAATDEIVGMRQALPPNYCSYMGIMHSDKVSDESRTQFLKRVKRLARQVAKSAPWDDAADQMAVQYMQRRLPLYGIGRSESDASASRNRANLGKVPKVDCTTRVRLADKDAARMSVEGDQIVLYHILDNKKDRFAGLREQNKDDDQFWGEGEIEFDLDAADTLEALVRAFPDPLVLEGWTPEMLEVAQELVDRGIVQVV